MNIEELFERLQNLIGEFTNKEIAEIWGMDEASFSRKKKAGTKIKPKNLRQIEQKYSISLSKDSNSRNKNSIKEDYKLSDEDFDFINSLLENNGRRNMAKMFFWAIEGDGDAKQVVESLMDSPYLASEFSGKSPEEIIATSREWEEKQYQATLKEAKNAD